MTPDGRHHDVELLAAQSLESRTQILAVDHETQRTLVHVEHDEKFVRHNKRGVIRRRTVVAITTAVTVGRARRIGLAGVVLGVVVGLVPAQVPAPGMLVVAHQTLVAYTMNGRVRCNNNKDHN